MSSDVREQDAADADRLAELEEERRFLLRSLSDLEREHEVGDVDDVDYEALKDGYTLRAATVLHAIDERRSALPTREKVNRARFAILVALVVFVALGLGWLVARSSGQRLPGDTITGGTSPNQVATLLSEGRVLMNSDAPNAVSEASTRFLAVLDIEPDNVEALTYSGWLVAVASQSQVPPNADNLAAGKQFLEKAITIDPTYADAHCLLAFIAGTFDQDVATARQRVDECMALDPPADLRGFIAEFATTLDATADSTPAGASATTEIPQTTG